MCDGGGGGLGDEIPGQAGNDEVGARNDIDRDHEYTGVGDDRDGDAGAACIDEPGGLAGAVGRPCCRSNPNAAGAGMDPKAPLDRPDGGRRCAGPAGRCVSA